MNWSLVRLKQLQSALWKLPQESKHQLRPLFCALHDEIQDREDVIGMGVARDVYPPDWGVDRVVSDRNGTRIMFHCQTQERGTLFIVYEEGNMVHVTRYPDKMRLGALFVVLPGTTIAHVTDVFTEVCVKNGEDDWGWIGPTTMLLFDGEKKLQAHMLFNERALE